MSKLQMTFKSCFIAAMILGAYYIYMTIGPGGDGVIFGSVVLVLGVIAGIKVQDLLQVVGK